MLTRNPFKASFAEAIDSSAAFVSLFEKQAIDVEYDDGITKSPFISEELFHKTVLFSSTNGGGKSTILHLFSPDVLLNITRAQGTYPECFGFLRNLGVIENDRINTLGVIISCVSDYASIESIYNSNISEQVFYVLLSIRIIKETLKSILILKELGTSDLSKITFCTIPSELSTQISFTWTGADVYKWACDLEVKMCNALNNMDEPGEISNLFGCLAVFSLFEPTNILVEGSCFVNRTLFMFDDIHKLTQTQQKSFMEYAVTARPKVGIWLAQRTYAFTSHRILEQEATLRREFVERRIEKLFINRTSDKAFVSIANKRVVASTLSETTFQNCLADEIDFVRNHKYSQAIESATEKIIAELLHFYRREEIDELKNKGANIYKQAIIIRATKILVDKVVSNKQGVLFLGYLTGPTIGQIKEEIDKGTINTAAEYYFCIENHIPFYFGISKICALASNNIYQFLDFAGEIFERRIALQYDVKRKNSLHVLAEEQDSIIRRVCEARWKMIGNSFLNFSEVRSLLENIAYLGIRELKKGHASYAGGAFTGFGIQESLMKQILEKEKYAEIKNLLATCVSNNLLTMVQNYQGKKGNIVRVFYLNRWVCVYFNLPLAYGGWKKCGTELMKQLCLSTNEEFKQYIYSQEGVGINV